MLNGIDPIIIFEFNKRIPLSPDTISNIPFVSSDATSIPFPPIPIYLSENLTGLFIQSEDKSIDVETSTETKTDGSSPAISQKGVASVVSINLIGKKDSIGLSLLSALMDQAYEKVSAQEYTITYLHGAVTIFRGLLHHYSANQNADNDLLSIKIDISKGEKQPEAKFEIAPVPKIVGTLPGAA